MRYNIRPFIVSTVLLFGLTSSMAQQNLPDENVSLQVRYQGADPSAPAPQISVDVPVVQNAAEAAKLIDDKVRSSDIPVLITTDRADLIREMSSTSPEAAPKDVYLAAYGDIVAEKEIPRWRQTFKSYASNIKNAANNDRIGLMVMTITLGYESFLWFNATSMSTLAQTSNFIYSLLLVGTFGIDKDGWSRYTKPIQTFFKKITGNAGAQWDRTNPKDIATRFISSFTLSLGLNTIRYGLLSMDSIFNGTFEFTGAKLQALIALSATISSFAWAEHISLIDQKTSPVARFFFSRVYEGRALVLGLVASTVMLINPVTYGITPWIALSISGTAGILVYLNAEYIRSWIEKNSVIRGLVTKLAGVRMFFPAGNILTRVRCEAIHRGAHGD